MNKNCLNCKNFYFSPGCQGYGEISPGRDILISCQMDYWELDPNEDSEDDFRRKMESAENCKHFEEREC